MGDGVAFFLEGKLFKERKYFLFLGIKEKIPMETLGFRHLPHSYGRGILPRYTLTPSETFFLSDFPNFSFKGLRDIL